MTTLTHSPIAMVSVPAAIDAEQRFVLQNVTWESYLALGRMFADRPALRFTYDRGRLEFMTTSSRHERFKRFLGRFIETIAEELNQPIMPGGSMTFQRDDLGRGFEPDDCFWIANESAVRESSTWEPDRDPPPDLMLEIEVSRSALDRMAIFAAFRVPEVWCFDGTALRIHILQTDGTYQRSERSLAFPAIPVHDMVAFFPTESTDYLSAVAAVRAWVRSHINQAT